MIFNTKRAFLSRTGLILLIGLLVPVFLLGGCGPAEQPEISAEARVYILAIDAFRADKLAVAETPTLDGLIEQGAYVESTRVTVPSQTRVNFVTLPTGTHADRHGVVGSSYRNPDWRFRSTDFPDYEGAQNNLPVPTIFEVVGQELGMSSAYYAMKGYELVGARGADFQTYGEEYLPAEHWQNRYQDEIDGSWDRAVELKQEMDQYLFEQLVDLVETDNPHLILANFAALDYVGHQHGVEDDYLNTITNADRLIGEFLQLLEEHGLRENSTIVITSDHGMTPTNPENVIMGGHWEDPDFPQLDELGIEHSAHSRGGLSFSLYIRDSERIEETYDWLREQSWAEMIYSEHELSGLDGTLSELNYYYPGRTGDFFISVDNNYTVGFPSRGQHGSLRDSDMYVPLIMVGPGIRQGLKIDQAGAAQTVDIAPTILHLLGLDPLLHLDAQGTVLEDLLE